MGTVTFGISLSLKRAGISLVVKNWASRALDVRTHFDVLFCTVRFFIRMFSKNSKNRVVVAIRLEIVQGFVHSKFHSLCADEIRDGFVMSFEGVVRIRNNSVFIYARHTCSRLS